MALCYQALLSAERNPNCVGLIGAPTYPMLRDVTIPAMLQILEEKRIKHEYHKSEYTLIFPRSRVLFRSLENYERLRGPIWPGSGSMS